MLSSFCIMPNGLFLYVPFLFPTSPFDPLTISQYISQAFALELVLQHKLFLFFGHFACRWNPFTRLKMKKDVCLLFPQVYQTISNIPSSAGCAMQGARRTEKPKE